MYEGRGSNHWLYFSGFITAADTTLPAHVAVDPSGLELPRISVNLPQSRPRVLAHIGAHGQICYAAQGSIVLDIFDIAGQTLGCIGRATEVLDKALRGEMEKDLEDEFFVFWHGELCFLDIYTKDSNTLDVVFARHNKAESYIAIVSNDASRTQEKLKAMAFSEQNFFPGAAFRVHTSAKPKPQQGAWPPANVANLLQWQGLLDPAAKRNIESRLLKAISSKKTSVLCVIDSPLTQYAFWVKLDEPKDHPPTRRKRDLRVKLYAAPVYPMNSIRMDDKYIAERNSPGSPTLAGKHIAVIGCGTIGGFLSELLVKAGAGLESGALALIDPDILLPQNIGRHHLGLNHALQYKANALQEELSNSAPTAQIKSHPVRAEDIDLTQFDLVINATGEEALGHYLTRKSVDTGKFVPTLSVWIEGPGIAVRALLQDSPTAACTRCLADSQRTPRYPVTNEPIPTELAGHGCESLYVPFPAHVSVQAACLGMEVVACWLTNKPSPRLRTKMTRSGFSSATPDIDPEHQTTCPACHS